LVKLIVGLGNPGNTYERTRHNVGFLVIDRIAAQNRIVIDRRFCRAAIGEGMLEGEKVVLAKPQTYVNRSGATVADLIRKYEIGTSDLVVINDDLDLPFGRIRIRPSGSAGGHRGLLSIMQNLGDAPFQRIRVGIGRPPQGREAVEYVLGAFDASETERLAEVVQRAAESLKCLVRDGIDRAMAIYNQAS
jgi:PTH1 family peptidyl-tRNA hydrolase